MRYLVVSDNHGDRDILTDIRDKYQETVDYFFHCGDSELDATDSLWDTYQVVRGNCDFGPGFDDSRVIQTGEDTIFMTHGHLYNVRMGFTRLSLQAQEVGAQLVFFGHTHQVACEQEQGILYLNPGSVSQPRGPIHIPTYALIDVTEDSYMVQYYNRAHQPVEELRFDFSRVKK
ncbi:MAG: metallophosphoesterase [Enterococcus sp.]